MKRIAIAVCAVVVSFAISSIAQTPANHTGTYTLVTIDGNKLPYAPQGAPEIQSGTITLNADGTFISAMSYRLASGEVASRDFSGTYTRDGSRFSLQWEGAGITTATLEDNTFTMNNEGLLFAYRKLPAKNRTIVSLSTSTR